MTGYYERNVEDVNKMLACAKQKQDEVSPLTQIFYYPPESESKDVNDSLRLMALDEEFIKKLENGERFTFKGSGDERVVLCTTNETFEVKQGEISNSLLLCPNLLYNSDVQKLNYDDRQLKEQKIYGVYHNYLELRLTFPRLSKLREILKKTEYCGPKMDDINHQGFYTYELLDIIQCSRDELTEHLKELKAICMEGKWRILSLAYTADVFSYIISLMEKEKWNEIPVVEVKEILQPMVQDIIFDHIIQHYAKPVNEEKTLYTFKDDAVSRCYAEVLLRTAEGKFRYNEFMMAWTQCLHPVIKASLNDLKGLVLIENDDGYQKSINLFTEEDLPENIPERFRLLFKRKEKWTLDEITPYIQKLSTKNMNVNTILTKFARSSNVNGTKIFSARYAK